MSKVDRRVLIVLMAFIVVSCGHSGEDGRPGRCYTAEEAQMICEAERISTGEVLATARLYCAPLYDQPGCYQP